MGLEGSPGGGMGWLMGGDGFREMIEGEGRKKGRREGVEKRNVERDGRRILLQIQ